MNGAVENNSEYLSPQEQPQGFLRRIVRNIGSRVMLEIVDRSFLIPESEIDMMVRHENEMIDLQKAGHETNIFRQKKFNETETVRLNELTIHFKERLASCHTMSDRFELFMDEAYADDIYTLDLGETKEAGSHDAVEAIKEEYHELEHSLVDRGIISGELSRADAKRTVHFYKSAHPDYFRVTRHRTLFCFEKDGRKISVAKRMTFLLDKSAIPEGSDPIGSNQNGRNHIALTQKLIDRQAEEVLPVRTVYFVTSKEIK